MTITLTGALEISVTDGGVTLSVKVEDARRCTEAGDIRVTEDGETRTVE